MEDEVAVPGAPQMDFVFTVRDGAVAEPRPFRPGQPVTAHWGVSDPAAVRGSDGEKRRAFHRAFRERSNRINPKLGLPLGNLDEIGGIGTPGPSR